jgi:hypothetical protein
MQKLFHELAIINLILYQLNRKTTIGNHPGCIGNSFPVVVRKKEQNVIHSAVLKMGYATYYFSFLL